MIVMSVTEVIGNCELVLRNEHPMSMSGMSFRFRRSSTWTFLSFDEHLTHAWIHLDAHRKQKMHERFGGGDFGSFGGIWDRIFGTEILG